MSVNARRWRFPPREAAVRQYKNSVGSPGGDAAVGIAAVSDPWVTAYFTPKQNFLHLTRSSKNFQKWIIVLTVILRSLIDP